MSTTPPPPELRTHDGLTLRLRHWPAVGARGTVLIVHGLGEHIGRYEHVAAQLNGWGWSVLGYDQRGHGRSEGPRGRLADRDDLLRDLALLVDAVRATAAGPLVLLGHSMGGLVAARFVAGGVGTAEPWSREVDALVLSSPALDPGMNAWQKLLLAVLGRLAPDLAVNNGLKPEWISRDAAVVHKYIADPLVHDRIAPRLARFIVDGGRFVRERAAAWCMPTLLLWAGGDRCVAPAGSAAFAAAASPALLQAHVFASLFHEIFNEPEQGEVFAVLRDWLVPFGTATTLEEPRP
jgi:alpha-beta hydrolase superfamily lysophospholipase